LAHQNRSRPPASPAIHGGDRVLSYLLGAVARLLLTFRRPQKFSPDTIRTAQSFLFIRPEGLGDLILTLPAIAYIRRENPGARLAMAVRPAFAKFVRDMQVVDEIIPLDYPKRSTLTPRQLRPFLGQVWRMRGRYDVAFDFRGDARNAIIGAWAAPIVTGPGAAGTQFLLSARYQDSTQLPAAERNLGIVSLGQATPPAMEDYAPAFRYHVGEGARQHATELLPSREKYVLVHPGASKPSNRWDPGRWRDVVRGLLESGKHVVITGAGAEDSQLATEIQEGLPGALTCLVDRTDCADLTPIVERAQLVISPDTGIAHIAFAQRIPSVTLFGSESEFLWGHEGPIHAALCTALPCRPCGAYRCPRTDFPMECMASITVEQVCSAASAVLLASAETRTCLPG